MSSGCGCKEVYILYRFPHITYLGKLGHSCTNVTKGNLYGPRTVIMLLCI